MTYLVPHFRYGALIYNDIHEEAEKGKENKKY